MRLDAAPTSLAIRVPRLDEEASWRELFEGYNAFYGREGPTALAPAVIESTWKRIHDRAEPVKALVAEVDGALVGLAHYLFHRTTIAIPDTCYLQDLFTAPQARGRGVAGALIQAVCERAREAGAHRVYWQTHESNTTAQRLYDRVAERTGFIVYRRLV